MLSLASWSLLASHQSESFICRCFGAYCSAALLQLCIERLTEGPTGPDGQPSTRRVGAGRIQPTYRVKPSFYSASSGCAIRWQVISWTGCIGNSLVCLHRNVRVLFLRSMVDVSLICRCHIEGTVMVTTACCRWGDPRLPNTALLPRKTARRFRDNDIDTVLAFQLPLLQPPK